MNIETANRLYQYRKSLGISQEELASRIGVSRQAVSKWERAEASPDTDNLIELAKIYGVSLDELLQGKAEEESAEESAPEENAASDKSEAAEESGGYHPSGRGINVENENESVHVGFDGIHVRDKNGTRVDVDRKHGVFVTENGEQKVYTDEDGHIHRSDDVPANGKDERSAWTAFPYPVITIIAYVLFGFLNICGGWAFGWIVFLTIPIYYTTVEAIRRRDANIFCYPVVALIAFFIMGFGWELWHPGWVVFLTIPVYYAIVNTVKGRKK